MREGGGGKGRGVLYRIYANLLNTKLSKVSVRSAPEFKKCKKFSYVFIKNFARLNRLIFFCRIMDGIKIFLGPKRPLQSTVSVRCPI